MPNPALAKDLLERLVKETAKVVANRKWRVPVLKEFYPKNRSLLGLNVNRGSSIMIRLREGDDQFSFLPWHSVLGTLVHELTHIEVGAHSAEFYKMMETVYDEVEASNSGHGGWSVTGPNRAVPAAIPTHFEGKSAKVGGGSLARSAGIAKTDVRQLAAEAALRRVQGGFDNGPRRLGGGAGGGPELSAVRRREMFLAAENERRLLQSAQSGGGGGGQGCSVVNAPLSSSADVESSGSSSNNSSRSGAINAIAEAMEGEFWSWTCMVCMEDNITPAPVQQASAVSSSSGNGGNSKSGSNSNVIMSISAVAVAACAWCGCAMGSSLTDTSSDGGGSSDSGSRSGTDAGGHSSNSSSNYTGSMNYGKTTKSSSTLDAFPEVVFIADDEGDNTASAAAYDTPPLEYCQVSRVYRSGQCLCCSGSGNGASNSLGGGAGGHRGGRIKQQQEAQAAAQAGQRQSGQAEIVIIHDDSQVDSDVVPAVQLQKRSKLNTSPIPEKSICNPALNAIVDCNIVDLVESDNEISTSS